LKKPDSWEKKMASRPFRDKDSVSRTAFSSEAKTPTWMA